MRTRPGWVSLTLGILAAIIAVPANAHAAEVVDVPAPLFWDAQAQQRIGGDADRFELDDAHRSAAMSAYYHLSYVVGGDRIQVHDHNASTSTGVESDIAKSENVAWHVAGALLGGPGGVARAAEIPAWARPRTGGADGTSAGIVFALADIDLLTPGRLAADLRVAGTGSIGSDGTVTAVRGVDAKLAAARLAHADVMFAPDFPAGTGPVTTVISHLGRDDPDRRIGDWLDTAGYEDAGRRAAGNRDASPSSRSTTPAKPSPGSAAAPTAPWPAPSPMPRPTTPSVTLDRMSSRPAPPRRRRGPPWCRRRRKGARARESLRTTGVALPRPAAPP